MTFFTQLWLLNRGSRSVTLWAHLGLALACTLGVALYVLGVSGARFVKDQVLGGLPDQELKLSMKTKDMAIFRMTLPGSAGSFGPQILGQMQEIPGVSAAYPLVYGNRPTELELNFMGNRYDSQLLIQGIDPQWIADEVDPALLAWAPGKPIPVIASTQLLTIYNSGYAKSRGLPQLSPQALMTPTWLLRYKGPHFWDSREAKVVGFSSKVALAAVIPRSVLDQWHEELGLEPVAPSEAVLSLTSQADLDQIRREIDALGFQIEEPHPFSRLFRQIRGLGQVLGLAMVFISGCFLFALLNLTLKMLFLVKQRDYAVCRAMGMSLRRLRLLLISELLLLLSGDLLAGLALGLALARILNSQVLADLLIGLTGSPMTLLEPGRDLAALSMALLALGMALLLPRIFSDTRA